MEFGPLEYLGAIWGISAVLLAVTAGVSKNMYRIVGVGSYVVLMALGSIGGLLAMPVVAIADAGVSYSLPLMAVGFILSIPVIHYVIPALAPDFQTQGFGATLLLAFEVGVAVLIAAYLTHQVDYLIPWSAIQGPGEFPSGN